MAFCLVPTVRGIYLSFTEYSILGEPEWIGVDNYTAIFKDELFWNGMAVTLQYVGLNMVLQFAIALGLALLMHGVAKSTLVRGALLLPFFVANVVVALLWFWMLTTSWASSTRSSAGWGFPASPSSAANSGQSPLSPSSTSGSTWATPPC